MIYNVILVSSIQQRDSVIHTLFLLVSEYLCSSKIYDHGHFLVIGSSFHEAFPVLFCFVLFCFVLFCFPIVAFVSFLQDSV